MSRVAFWFLIYSDFATMVAFMMAGVWGAGNSIMPLAAGAAHGSNLQEAAISVVAYSAGPTGIVSFALILWGLRIQTPPPKCEQPKCPGGWNVSLCGGLNRSTQHFIVEGKDRECRTIGQ